MFLHDLADGSIGGRRLDRSIVMGSIAFDAAEPAIFSVILAWAESVLRQPRVKRKTPPIRAGFFGRAPDHRGEVMGREPKTFDYGADF